MTHPSIPEAEIEIPDDIWEAAKQLAIDIRNAVDGCSCSDCLIVAHEHALAALLAKRRRAIVLLPISTAPDLERVMVAGWQPRNGNVAGYWWYEEGMADGGRDLENPRATHWFPISLPVFPAAPVEA